MAVDLTHNFHKRGFAFRIEKRTPRITMAAGNSAYFLIAVSVILSWYLKAPVFDFSDTWQLVIYTGTAVVTFPVVYVFQRAQPKAFLAVLEKLAIVIAAEEQAGNRMVDMEGRTQPDMEKIKKIYGKGSLLSKKQTNLFSSLSSEETGDVLLEKVMIIKTRAEKRKPKSA